MEGYNDRKKGARQKRANTRQVTQPGGIRPKQTSIINCYDDSDSE